MTPSAFSGCGPASPPITTLSANAFKERKISKAYCKATEAEQEAFDILTNIQFARLDKKRGAGQLFRTTLEKSLFSSPAACLKTIRNRINRLGKEENSETIKDIDQLEELAAAVERITPHEFSKYQKLLQVINDKKHGLGWTGKDRTDRLVIFTERIETLRFLRHHLPQDLGLKDNQVEILHGAMSDVEQQRVVEDFGKDEARVRLLLASDVASEGINLHYLSHRLIHFDIPWSLMVFQQRNGHIDRNGQEKTPYILYLVTQSDNPKIRSAGRCGEEADARTRDMPSLYADDYAYFKTVVSFLRQSETLQTEFYDDEQQVVLTATRDLKHRLRYTLPREVWPQDDVFILSADREDIQDEIKRSRKDETAWPRIQYLWPHNPVVQWVNDKVVASFGRHEAPVLTLQGALAAGETVFILSGLIPNRKGHPLVHRWFGISYKGNAFQKIETLEKLFARTGLGKKDFPNRGIDIDTEPLRELLPDAVRRAREFMSKERKVFEDAIDDKLNEQYKELARLKDKQYKQLELFYVDARKQSKKEQRRREIDKIFDEFLDWIEDTMTTEDKPYIQVAAVLKG